MKTQYLQHANGGTIKEIFCVGHETYKGVADWFYMGSVEWSDGTKSANATIAPWALCCDQENPLAKAELNTVTAILKRYLDNAGTWHEPKQKNAMRYSWTPHKPTGTNLIIKATDAPT